MVRQPNATMMLTATSGVIATANRLKLCVTPCTSPRSDLANHSCMARVAMGNAPASLNPRTKRIAIRVTTPVVNPVKTTVSDQKGIIARSTLLGPKRSPSHPPGICPIAYAHKNALKTNPVAVLLSPNSFAMAGAATEMLLRSMYVSKYIRLIRNRTTHRVFVGLTAALSEMALDSRRGGMLVSNIVSVAAGRRGSTNAHSSWRGGAAIKKLNTEGAKDHGEPQRNRSAALSGVSRTFSAKLSVLSVAFLRVLCVKFRKAQEIAGARPAVARSIAPDCQSEETPSGRMATGRPSSADKSAAWYTCMTILACSGVTSG